VGGVFVEHDVPPGRLGQVVATAYRFGAVTAGNKPSTIHAVRSRTRPSNASSARTGSTCSDLWGRRPSSTMQSRLVAPSSTFVHAGCGIPGVHAMVLEVGVRA